MIIGGRGGGDEITSFFILFFIISKNKRIKTLVVSDFENQI